MGCPWDPRSPTLRCCFNLTVLIRAGFQGLLESGSLPSACASSFCRATKIYTPDTPQCTERPPALHPPRSRPVCNLQTSHAPQVQGSRLTLSHSTPATTPQATRTPRPFTIRNFSYTLLVAARTCQSASSRSWYQPYQRRRRGHRYLQPRLRGVQRRRLLGRGGGTLHID